MRRLLSIAFWSFFAISSLAGFLVSVVLWIVTTPFDRDRRLNHWFTCAWGSLYAMIYPGWEIRTLHRERIQVGRPHVIVANHTSIADIVLCFLLFRQFKWVSKLAVFRVPLIGWNMRLCRYVPLVRGDPESIARMLETCRHWLRRGVSVMMFPEGTRSEDGMVRPFKHGAFSLALETGVPIVPVVIHGGAQLLPKHKKTFASKAQLRVEVLDPVPPEGYSDALAYANDVRARIQRALGQSFDSAAILEREGRSCIQPSDLGAAEIHRLPPPASAH